MPKEKDEVLELEEEDILEDEDEESGEDADDEGEEEESLTVQIGDEEPEEVEEAPEWVKELRKANREKDKRIKELEGTLKEKDAPADKPGPKPTLEGCDYDEAAFEKKLDEWKDGKRHHEAKEESAKEEQRKADERWQEKLAKLQDRKRELKVPDMEEAEDFIRETLSIEQQGMIVQGAKDPALLFLALARNKKKAKELAAVADHIEFAFAASDVEAQLKTGKKSSAPPPEKGVSGRAGTGGAVDNTLEKLREKAAKTGDMSPVMAYKRKLKEKA